MESKGLIFMVLLTFPVILSLLKSKIDLEEIDFSVFLQKDDGIRGGVSPTFTDLEYDYYRQTCPQAESIVRSIVSLLYAQQNDAYAALLRLFFHDCFIEGCDASVLLDDSYGNKNYSIERNAVPNQTLRGFDKIDIIKEEIENFCPGVVSCADILALATRDAIVLAGGPFYPVFTGRRDSIRSFFDKASTEIPSPFDNIRRILDLFYYRGFDKRETVALLGGHNVGKMSCTFILGRPDFSMASDFLHQLRFKCQDHKETTQEKPVSHSHSLSIPSGATFDDHYYRNLLQGKGLLFSDQQLMADEETARFVRVYASDDGNTFRRHFARAMVKMSNLGVLTGTRGQVRTKCSLPAK